MSIQIISHTDHSRLIETQGMGEIVNAQKIKDLLCHKGFRVQEIWDIFDLFGGGMNGMRNIAQLTMVNRLLAQENLKLIEDFQMQFIDPIWDRFEMIKESIQALFLLTWDFNLAAFLGTGIQRSFPTISKCYAFHAQEKISRSLFDSSHLVITESLLGNNRAIAAGIAECKIIYLPHHFPENIQHYAHQGWEMREHYFNKLAAQSKKNIQITSKTVVIGLFGRFQFRKNIEYAIQVMHRIIKEYPDTILLIKGNFDKSADMYEGQGYSQWLENLFNENEQENWLLWDKSSTPFPDILYEYAACDILMNLSGSESASNSIVEFMALGRPCIVLNASTNPYLFKGGVEMVEVVPELRKGKLHFYQPDPNDLYKKLIDLIENKQKREDLAAKAKKIAEWRFAPQLTLDRMPLILEAAHAFFYKKNVRKYQKAISEHYRQDLKRYELDRTA